MSKSLKFWYNHQLLNGFAYLTYKNFAIQSCKDTLLYFFPEALEFSLLHLGQQSLLN